MFGWYSELKMLRRVNKELRREMGELRDKLKAAETAAVSLRTRLVELAAKEKQMRVGDGTEQAADNFVRAVFRCPPTIWVPVNQFGVPLDTKPTSSFEEARRDVCHNAYHLRIVKYVFAGIMKVNKED